MQREGLVWSRVKVSNKEGVQLAQSAVAGDKSDLLQSTSSGLASSTLHVASSTETGKLVVNCNGTFEIHTFTVRCELRKLRVTTRNWQQEHGL